MSMLTTAKDNKVIPLYSLHFAGWDQSYYIYWAYKFAYVHPTL